jgi:hypothetical protein
MFRVYEKTQYKPFQVTRIPIPERGCEGIAEAVMQSDIPTKFSYLQALGKQFPRMITMRVAQAPFLVDFHRDKDPSKVCELCSDQGHGMMACPWKRLIELEDGVKAWAWSIPSLVAHVALVGGRLQEDEGQHDLRVKRKIQHLLIATEQSPQETLRQQEARGDPRSWQKQISESIIELRREIVAKINATCSEYRLGGDFRWLIEHLVARMYMDAETFKSTMSQDLMHQEDRRAWQGRWSAKQVQGVDSECLNEGAGTLSRHEAASLDRELGSSRKRSQPRNPGIESVVAYIQSLNLKPKEKRKSTKVQLTEEEEQTMKSLSREGTQPVKMFELFSKARGNNARFKSMGMTLEDFKKSGMSVEPFRKSNPEPSSRADIALGSRAQANETPVQKVKETTARNHLSVLPSARPTRNKSQILHQPPTQPPTSDIPDNILDLEELIEGSHFQQTPLEKARVDREFGNLSTLPNKIQEPIELSSRTIRATGPVR